VISPLSPLQPKNMVKKNGKLQSYSFQYIIVGIQFTQLITIFYARSPVIFDLGNGEKQPLAFNNHPF
jgi:hypothetical protein